MDSSKRFILQAEIEYWHEMLRLNQDRVSDQKESEMRFFLKQAMIQLNRLEQATAEPVAA